MTTHRSRNIWEFFADIPAQSVYTCPFMHGHVLKSPVDRLGGDAGDGPLLSVRFIDVADALRPIPNERDVAGSHHRCFQGFFFFFSTTRNVVYGRTCVTGSSGRDLRRNCENVYTLV